MTNFDAERHTAKEFAEMQQVFDEEDFLKMVRQCKSIGYGRMMQILTLPALKRRGFSEPNPEGIVKYPPTCSNSLT